MADAPTSKQLDRLYAASLDDFTAERDALAAELRKQGKPEPAQEVKRLRKPTVPAWAVNQASRRNAKQTKGLLKAGDALRDAQRSLSGRGGREALREAQGKVRGLVRDLRSEAEAALAEAGRPTTAAATEQIEATLHAAAVDPELGELVAAGRLERPGVAVGFPGVAPAPSGDGASKDQRKREGLEKRLRREQERLSEATRKREAAEAELREAEQAARAAAKDLDRAGRRARAETKSEAEAAERVERLRDELTPPKRRRR